MKCRRCFVLPFNRALRADHPYHKVNGGNYRLLRRHELNKMIKDIVKRSTSTLYVVKFELNWAEAPFVRRSITSELRGDSFERVRRSIDESGHAAKKVDLEARRVPDRSFSSAM